MRLPGKAAVITGAGMGIGRATALLFAREGARVLVADYDAQSGQETVRLIEQDGGQALFVRTDVTNLADVEAMVQTAKEAFDCIDILHNNAGIDLPQATNVVDTTVADWDRILDVNLKGVFLCSRQVIPVMIECGGGAILNTASIAGLEPMPQEAAYGASKAGLVLLTKQMARDYARYDIRVNSICPGPMESPTRDRLAFLQGDPKAFARRQTFADQIPLGRMCIPEDIASAALFLVSEDAAMITGIDLVIDGGYTLQ